MDSDAPSRAKLTEDERLQHERALAAELFPVDWAAALGMTGRKGNARRARLRHAAVYEMRMRPLREAGANCLSCRHRAKVQGIGQTCEIDSDFDGYAVIKDIAAGLCADWQARDGSGTQKDNPQGES